MSEQEKPPADSVLALIEGLYPKAKLSLEMISLMKERLAHRDKGVVMQAIKNVRCSKSGLQPELSWILAECDRLSPEPSAEAATESDDTTKAIEYQPTDNPWENNWARIKQLWPTAMFPKYLEDVFVGELSGLNQEWLTQAIQKTKCKFSSHQPELKWFLDAYERIEEKAWSSQDQTRTPIVPIIVDHVRVRDGQTREVSTVFTDRAEAEAFAKQQNGSIRGTRTVMSDNDLRSWLKSQSRTALQEAVDVVREQGWGEWQFPGDLDKWTPIMLGAVAGGIDVTQRRSARAAVSISSQEAA